MPLCSYLPAAAFLAFVCTAQAYEASFSEALDQPGRVFSGSGWKLAEPGQALDSVDAVVTDFVPPPAARTFSTEVTGPAAIRCRAWVFEEPPGQPDLPVTLILAGPGGRSRTIMATPSPPAGNAQFMHMVMPAAGTVTWFSAIAPGHPGHTVIVDQVEIFDPVLAPYVREALDQPGLTFMSASPSRWLLTTSNAHDNVDALVTGPLVQGEITDFEVAAPPGANGVRFWVKTAGLAASALRVSYHIDDDEAPLWSQSGVRDWTQVSLVLSPEDRIVRWAYHSGGAEAAGGARVDSVEFFTVSPIQDAIDLDEPVFATPPGAQGFTRTTANGADGIDAAEGPSNNLPAVMEATVSGPAVLTWDSAVTGGTPVLQVQLDAGAPYDCRDTGLWAHHAYWVPAGSHTVRFTASDPAMSGHRCLVDRMKFIPWIGSLPAAPGLTIFQNGAAAWEQVATPPGSRTTGPGFRTGTRTAADSAPFSRTPVLSAVATGPGWLSYRSSVTSFPGTAATLFAPSPSQNQSDGTRVVSMGLSGAGPHPLTWEFRGAGGESAPQQATLSDVEWTPGPHPLYHPGPWVISGNYGWTPAGNSTVDWGPASAGSRTSTLSTTVTGPGSLKFSWACWGFPPVSNNGYLRASVGGNSAFLAMSRDAPASNLSSAMITVPPGEQTVTWTFDTSLDGASILSPKADAQLRDVRMVDGLAEAAAALDTSLPLTSVTGWVLESASGWRDNDRLALNAGSGSLILDVTGPKVLSFRATSEGNRAGDANFSIYGSGGSFNATIVEPLDKYRENRAMVIPAGTHTITFNATAEIPPGSTGPYKTWKLDALETFTAADYATALNDTLTWTVGGSTGYVPLPQTTETHDGVSAVGFYRNYQPPGGTATLATTVTGPGVISWWQKGALSVKLDGVASAGDPSAWARRFEKLTDGTHTLTFSLIAPSAAWLDEVNYGTPFEDWLAGHLAAAQVSDPAVFSAAADTDQDGRSALVEYALQTSPVEASLDRAPVLTRDGADPELLHFTWRQSSAVSGVNFIPEVSADMNTWSALPAEPTGTDGTDALMRASFRSDTIPARRYVRLRIAEQ